MTLTLPALSAARAVWVVAFGEAKAAAIHETLHHPGSTLPIALAIRDVMAVTLFLDPEAARLVSG
jgi:6-phosphogluconolactonase/glucosamine-6-phosphate isomerase/deaminase